MASRLPAAVPVPRREPVPRPLLTLTKLLPPRLPATLVGGDRFAAWLGGILAHRLTLVCAPGGFGKSTLLAGWHARLAAGGHAVAWVTFDADDDEPIRALWYILEALDRARPGMVDEARAMARENGFVHARGVAAAIINAVMAQGDTVVLFFDDFHRLGDPQLQQFVSYLLLHAPPNLRLVIASQARPGLPLAWLQAHDAMQALGDAELRLGADEARLLLGHTAARLSRAAIDALHDAMGGWVTGLKIGSAALANNPEAVLDIGLAAQGAHWLGDYLDENIFQHQPPEMRAFLMRCAVVELLSPDLAARLAGVADASERLTSLARQNLFVEAVEGNDGFRLHPVFREFLLAQLHKSAPLEIAALHRAASLWFADHGQLPEAIRHAIAAGEPDRAVDWIEQASMAMVERSDLATLLNWIARLPAAAIAHRVTLRIAEAWALTLSLRPQVPALLDELDARIRASPGPRTAALLHETLGVRAIFTVVCEDRTDESLVLAERYLAASPPDSFATRAVYNAAAYDRIQLGDYDAASAYLRGSASGAVGDSAFTEAYRFCVTGIAYCRQGHLADAERAFAQGVERSERRVGRRSPSAALAACFLAESAFERGAAAEAADLLANRLDVIDAACFHKAVIAAYRTLVDLRMLAGDRAGAADALERAEQIGHERGWQRLLASCAVRRIRHGFAPTLEFDALLPEAGEAAALAAPGSLAARVFAIAAEGRFLNALAAGEEARAATVLARAAAYATATRNAFELLRCDLMEAHRRDAFGDAAGAAARLAVALPRAARFGMLRTVANLAPAALLARAASDDPAVMLMCARLTAPPPPLAAEAPSPSADANVFSLLTSREIDILIGVAAGLPNKGIARQLHLTPETVKWHLKNILRKLGAETRGQAVEAAIALGLTIA